MAMIQCSKCGTDISDKAKICPYCGEKYKRGNKKLIIFISIAVIIIIAAVVSVLLKERLLRGKDMNKGDIIQGIEREYDTHFQTCNMKV